MNKQTKSIVQSLLLLSIVLMLVGTVHIFTNMYYKINSTDPLSVPMILIGIVGVHTALLFKFLSQRIDKLEKKN